MRRAQYDDLVEKFGPHRNYDDVKVENGVMLVAMTGRQRNKAARLVRFNNGTLTVLIGEKEFDFNYAKLEFADENGLPVIEPTKDMTGRPMEIGTLICYSISAGRNSHACEIGRVTRIHPSGAVSARPIVRNGEVLVTNSYFTYERRSISPSRALRLPVDTPMITMWLLSDFERFKEEEM